MSLSFDNFRQAISPEIVKRGRDYFNNGHVQNLDEVGEGHWQGEVAGAHLYSIEIRTMPDGSLEQSCNCLYDRGPVCKHIAAVLFAIEDNFSEYVKKPKQAKKPRKKRETKAEKLDRLLVNAQYEDVIEILKAIALDDPVLYNQLALRFDDIGNKGKYVRMVKDALKLGRGKHGFIDYWGSDRAADAVRVILSEARNFLDNSRVEKALPILQAVLETVTPAMAHADDSNGSLGYCISTSMMYLAEAANEISGSPRAEFFNYLLKMAQAEDLQAWDWGWDVAQIAADMIQTSEERDRVFATLDSLDPVPGSRELDFSSKFDMAQVRRIKLSMIERQDGAQEIEQFLIENIDIYDFREKLVNFYLEHHRLEEAKKVCEDYLSKPEDGYRRNQAAFLKPLLEIAQLENDDQQTLKLAENLFYATLDFAYYDLLKDRTPDQSWEKTFQELLTKVRVDFLPNIYVREEMWGDLLTAAQKMGEYSLEDYRFYLEKYFPKETCEIYSRIIYTKLEITSNREVYRDACRYLRRLMKLGQEEMMESIVADLRIRYKIRPALLDELNKI